MPVAGLRKPNKVVGLPTVCVLHGAWLPGASDGDFVVWAETLPGGRRPRKDEHPFQVRRAPLEAWLKKHWPTAGVGLRIGSKPIGRAWAILPGGGERPAPSLELQAELEDVGTDAPSSLSAWRIDMVRIASPLEFLAGLDNQPGTVGRTVRIGHDLRFWQHLAERLRWAVRRHEYLPSIWAKPGPQDGAPQGRSRLTLPQKPAAEFKVGWELAESAEDAIVAAFAKAMPVACRAVRLDADRMALHEPAALVRHFLEANLHWIVEWTPFTQAQIRRFQGTLLETALPDHPYSLYDSSSFAITDSIWTQWRRWRDLLQRSATAADERVCFRLVDAKPSAPDSWRLEWLLSSRSNPSKMQPMADFWDTGKLAESGTRSVQEVLLQIGQAARLYGKLWEGMNSAAPAGVDLDRAEALAFLREQAPILQAAGFRVTVPAWWTATGQRRLRLRLVMRGAPKSEAVGSESSGLLGFKSLVRFEPQVVLNGKLLTHEEWERVASAKEGLVELRGQWMELQPGEVERLEEYWNAPRELHEMTLEDLLRTEARAGRERIEVAYEGELGRSLAALRGTGALEMLDQPDGFVGQLRAYQLRGFSWLTYLERLGLGACLADDMGLGKTVQVIATILADKVRNPAAAPTLLVAPTSVLGNWEREARRFAPALVAYIHHGPQRAKTAEALGGAIKGADLVIASFGVARLDAAALRRLAWRRLVIDESQNIKNPSAVITKALRAVPAERRIALTGTPVENRLTDLWSLFSVLNPGHLGTVAEFRKQYERPIMRDGDRAVAESLRSLVRPFILRRMKTDKQIIKDLPDKLEQKTFCNLTPEQAGLYEAVVRDMGAKLEQSELNVRRGLVFAILTKLKQICNHPAQFLQDGSEFRESRSHKLGRVCQMLDDIEAEGESALVFTQFAEIGKSLEALFRRRYGGAVYYLHGGTPRTRREHMVAEFQNPDTERAIFVLSLRAGGTGLTLTRANHVIHFDRWWNPAVENQATDRAYRIGQSKAVFVHKMVTMGTLEERIDELIESKKKLADEIVGSDESWLSSLDNDTFRRLIALDASSAVVS